MKTNTSIENKDNEVFFLDDLEKTVLIKADEESSDWKKSVYGFECANFVKC